jgi:hypothetical protein
MAMQTGRLQHLPFSENNNVRFSFKGPNGCPLDKVRILLQIENDRFFVIVRLVLRTAR